jgi:hypothetical protein
VFNGDFVDRGSHQLEVLLLLFSLKIAHPSRVILLRGNHETTSVSSFYGFKKECHRVSCSVGRHCPLFQASLDLFEWLPVAAVVSAAVLVLHGGIGDGLWSLEQLRQARRPISDDILEDDSVNHVLANVLWSDPIDGVETSEGNRRTQVTLSVLCIRKYFEKGFCLMFFEQTSERGGNFLKFGIDVSRDFCARNALKMIVRSHQYWTQFPGYKVHHEGRVVTVILFTIIAPAHSKHINEAYDYILQPAIVCRYSPPQTTVALRATVQP